MVPVVVPCNVTFTPGKPVLSSLETTLPDTVCAWAEKAAPQSSSISKVQFVMCVFIIGLVKAVFCEVFRGGVATGRNQPPAQRNDSAGRNALKKLSGFDTILSGLVYIGRYSG